MRPVDIKPDHAALLAKLHGKRQAYIAKANHGQFHVVESEHGAISCS
jgi:hypothetical protein